MTNEVSLKFLLDQLKALINESKEINKRNKNTNEQFDSNKDQISVDELECLQEQFEDAELYCPEDDSFNVSNDLTVPSELVEQLNDYNSPTAEFTPDSAVTMSPSDLVLVCSASAPSVPSVANKSTIGYNQCSLVDALTLLRGFAQHAAPCSSAKNSGYKVWKPGLRSA